MRSRWTTALVVAACVGVGFGTAFAFALPRSSHTSRLSATSQVAPAQGRWGPRSKRAPGFVLKSSSGRPVSLRTERGRIVLLTFLDSRCTRACPLEGRILADVQRELRKTSVPVSLLVVTVDPWGDTRKSIRTFAEKSGWTPPWRWLGGSPRALAPVWRAYGVGVKRVPGDILHTVALYVIDRHGYQRRVFLFPFDPRAVATDVRALART